MIVMFLLKKFHQFHKHFINFTYDSTLKINKGHMYKLSILNELTTTKEGVIQPTFNNLELVVGNIKLSYEALIPLFSLKGHEYRLMLFILAYRADKVDQCFKWNNAMVDEYCELYYATTGESVKAETVRQALFTLRKTKVINKLSRGHFQLNPLYTERPGKFEAEKLINNYLREDVSTGKTMAQALNIDTRLRAKSTMEKVLV
jgi:hypothetical protein